MDIGHFQMQAVLPGINKDPSKITIRPAILSKQGLKRWISLNPGEFAASFACSVTTQSNPEDIVARRGSLSIFSAFCQIYPEVI